MKMLHPVSPMGRRARAPSLAVLGLLAAALVSVPPRGASATPGTQDRPARHIDGRYIVMYDEGVARPGTATRALEGTLGFDARFSYDSAIEGFAASLTPGQVRALERHPLVEAIVPDRLVETTDRVPLVEGDAAPTGIRRIRAGTVSSTREASSVNVAVVDTGVDLDHPDLNAQHGINCVGSGPADDGNGHGTHVAGTIAAENDGAGVVGVAPGTRLFSVKVIADDGQGSISSLVCGIDWVTSTRIDSDPTNDIAVANVSLGGPGPAVRPCSVTYDAEHLAICRSTAAGVAYVVAAGNEGWDFDHDEDPDVPAAYPEVLTVTAMSDGDGAPGGASDPTCSLTAVDDRFASFSSFALTPEGAAHTIAAPGQCIRSTIPGGGYLHYSGTSMAAPHVAGAVALCLDEGGVSGPCDGMTPAQIIDKMRSDAAARPASYGFVGDPGHPFGNRYYGHLVWAGRPGDQEPPPPADTRSPKVLAISPAADATAVATDASQTGISITFDEPMSEAATQNAFSLVEIEDGSPVGGTFSWTDSTMYFEPEQALAEGSTYLATVTTEARDEAGNHLREGRSWSFKTIAHVSAAPDSRVVSHGSHRSGGRARLVQEDLAYMSVSSTDGPRFRTSWTARFANVPNSLLELGLAYTGKNSRTCNQVVSLFRWGTETWDDVDARLVGSTPVQIDHTVVGRAAGYVSGGTGAGDLIVRVRCEGARAFAARADAVGISYGVP